MGIIIRPIITEKMTAQGEKGRFGFRVDVRANKIQIKEAVEALYTVKVDSVNTINYTGKTKSRNTKSGVLTGKQNAFKKAIVTLAKGDTIDFYSNI